MVTLAISVPIGLWALPVDIGRFEFELELAENWPDSLKALTKYCTVVFAGIFMSV